MSNIPTSCRPNPEKFNIQEILAKPVLYPDKSILISMIFGLMKYSCIDNQESINRIFAILKEILPTLEDNTEEKKNLAMLLVKVSCQKCQDFSLNANLFPFLLCSRCYDLTHKSEKPRCYYCQVSFSDGKYFFNCGHLCKFCGAKFVRKGADKCPKCKNHYNQFLSLFREEKKICVTCNVEKYFVNDYMLRLKCSHYHCKDCLLNDIKKKKCIKCERPLAGSEINFILDFITSKCKICGIRKKQDEFTVKNCCLKDICTKCQERNLTVCLGCHQRIDT